MEITVWNSAKSRLETIDIEFTDDDTTWFEESEEGKFVQTLTDIDDGLLIKEHGYNYPVVFNGKSRNDIGNNEKAALALIESCIPGKYIDNN